jgi:hypothetical protein
MTTLADRGESTISMEPLLVGESSRWRATLHDKALELVAASARLDHSLPTGIAGGLARLVRSMNCYYSNLIEGHDTHPVDIERALHADYSKNPENAISNSKPGRTLPCSRGSTQEVSRDARPPPQVSARFTGDSARNSPTRCSRLRIQIRAHGIEWCQADGGSLMWPLAGSAPEAMSRLPLTTSRSALVPRLPRSEESTSSPSRRARGRFTPSRLCCRGRRSRRVGLRSCSWAR